MVDILAGVLTGFGYGAVPGRPNFGHYVAAYNVAGFDDPEHFKDTMDEWLRMMKSTRPAPGEERVMVAGQPEAEMEIIRRAEGIPLHQGSGGLVPRHLRRTGHRLPLLGNRTNPSNL